MNFKIPKRHRLHNQADKTALNRAADKSGLPPGSLVHIGEIRQPYDVLMTLVNIDGLDDINMVESIGRELNIHSLVLEDIQSTHQRLKLGEYDSYI